MTRVLMTADAVGGVWTYALELAQALADRGVATTLATMGPRPTAAQETQAARVSGLELEVSAYPLEWNLDLDGLWYALADAGDWLLDLEARNAADVVHLNGFVHGRLPFRAPTIVVGHSCLLSWRAANGGEFNAPALAAYKKAITAGLRHASCVVAPTRAMLAALQRHYGPLERTAVIPNRRSIYPASRSVDKEPIVATAGRLWDRAKNAGAVAAVAPHLDWPVTFVGSCEPDAPPEPQDHLLALLTRASIFVLPARYEPFGLLPLEAALAGCALVLGDIDSLHEVWADAAIYVDPDDHDALRRALQSLIDDVALRTEMARRARRRAAAYTPAEMARQYLDMYSAVGAARQCA
jgi:glycosyltransferase involved in cell wall biosynthesis